MKWRILAHKIDRGVGMEILGMKPGGPYRIREKRRGKVIFDQTCKDAKEVRRNLFESDQEGRRYMPEHWKSLLKTAKDDDLRKLV